MSANQHPGCHACIAAQGERLTALIELLTAKMSPEESQECASEWDSICRARGWLAASKAMPAVANWVPKIQHPRSIPGDLGAVSTTRARSLSVAKEAIFDYRMALQMAFETMTDSQFADWRGEWEEYTNGQKIASKLLDGLPRPS